MEKVKENEVKELCIVFNNSKHYFNIPVLLKLGKKEAIKVCLNTLGDTKEGKDRIKKVIDEIYKNFEL